MSDNLAFVGLTAAALAFTVGYTNLEQKGELPSIFSNSSASEAINTEPPRRRVRYVYYNSGGSNNNDHSSPSYSGGDPHNSPDQNGPGGM